MSCVASFYTPSIFPSATKRFLSFINADWTVQVRCRERKTTYLLSRDESALTQANSFCRFLCHAVQLKTFLLTFRIFPCPPTGATKARYCIIGHHYAYHVFEESKVKNPFGVFSLNVGISRLPGGRGFFRYHPGSSFLCCFFYSPVCFIKKKTLASVYLQGNALKHCGTRAKGASAAKSTAPL